MNFTSITVDATNSIDTEHTRTVTVGTMSTSTGPSTNQEQKKKKKDKKVKKKQVHKYVKRAGTSGIRGQLYETKLLGLIYFKALHDKLIEEFYLATNVDELGMFDDICLRAKIKGFDKPTNVFIQAKHRENDKLLTLSNKKDLANCFDSYLRIKRRFQPSNEDVLFKGIFDETDCVFVMYTTAKDDGNSKPCDSSLVTYLNNLIGTGNPGSQPTYTDEDIDLLYQQVLEEQLLTLAQKIVKYMFDDNANNQMMNDDVISRYHVILAREVFDISEIVPEGHRIASFRTDFFCQSQKFIQMFKDTLCSEILEKRKIDITKQTQVLLTRFLLESDNSRTLCDLIRGNVLTFKNGNLEFRDKMAPQQYKLKLDRINHSNKELRDEAVEMAVRECVPSLEFKVPATFGNKDLAIRGDDVKIDKRLDHLCKKFLDLIEKSKPYIIVTIDDSMEDGFLRLNGGIASGVGNLFVFDDTFKLFKFSENIKSLGNVAQRFYAKLQSKIENLHDYKFNMTAKAFPILTLDRNEYDERIVKDFFSKLVFYTSQGDENDVEKTTINEIKMILTDSKNPEKKSQAIFLKYHDEIQKWWMTPKEGSYLTKDSELYKTAVDSTSVINMMPNITFRQRVFCVENGRIVEDYDPEEREREESQKQEASLAGPSTSQTVQHLS